MKPITSMLALALALTATACHAPAATTPAQPAAPAKYKLLAVDDVTTLAGTGVAGRQDGLAPTFNEPDGLASDGRFLYATDANNHAVRRIDARTGEATTLAGNGMAGFANAAGAAARFRFPAGITHDARTGDLYVADRDNHCIRKVDPQGVVTTYAGTPQVAGNVDGPAPQARFRHPVGVAIAPDGTLYVSDYGNNRIRKVAPAGGAVTHVAGDPGGFAGYVDSYAHKARFRQPRQCALGPDGFLYVADAYNDALRGISLSGSVFTKARGLYRPETVAAGPDGALYVGGNLDKRIHRIGHDNVITTFAGTGDWGFLDGPRLAAQFRMPRGLAFDAAGDLFVADQRNHRIRKIDL